MLWASVLTKKDKSLAAAQKFLEKGQHDRALEEFARVVQEDENDTRTWLKMAEIYAQRGQLTQARDIYLRTAEIYVAQGFIQKAVTVYRSVLKLTPGQPLVRERLGDAYRQLGRVADALRELELAAAELIEAGRPAEALPSLRRIVGLNPDNLGSRIKLAETASQSGSIEEAIHELRRAADHLRQQGRGDDFVRVAERLLFHRPDDHAIARELAASYITRRNPRLALAKLQAPLRAAPRDPQNVALLAEALAQLDPAKAISVWRELAEIHDAAGRTGERDACIRAALALDPTDGETRELAARWGIPVSAVRARETPPPLKPPGSSITSGILSTPAPLPSVDVSLSGLSGVSGTAGTGAVTPPPMVSHTTGIGISGLISAPATDVTRILAEADVFVKYGLAERAVDHLRRVFAQYPQHRGARERLAHVLDHLGRRAEAAAELATLATHLSADGDPDAAGVAERALALDPTSARAAAVLGREPAPASMAPPPSSARARSTPPPPPSAASMETPPPLSASMVTPPPVVDTTDILEEIEQVDFFLDQSLIDEASSVLAELEQRFPGDPRLADKRRVIEALNRPQPGAIPGDPGHDSHIAPIAKLTVSENADPGTHGDLGIAYKQMGLLDAAIAEFKQVAFDPSRAVFALTMMGECLEAQGQPGEAVARYKEALNLQQASPTESQELYYLLGAVFERLGDKREALYFFENLRKRNPRFRDVERRIMALKSPDAHRV
jgi:tetratricopeptide (TPR) repeat protein